MRKIHLPDLSPQKKKTNINYNGYLNLKLNAVDSGCWRK